MCFLHRSVVQLCGDFTHCQDLQCNKINEKVCGGGGVWNREGERGRRAEDHKKYIKQAYTVVGHF